VPFVDDLTIQAEQRLLRRVHPKFVVPDENNEGQWRLSSAAFTDEELSIDLESVLLAEGLDYTATLQNHDGHSLVAFTAALARANEQAVARNPLADNMAHGIVAGRKTGRVKKNLRIGSEWLVLNPPMT
jgi:hypothetical protein